MTASALSVALATAGACGSDDAEIFARAPDDGGAPGSSGMFGGAAEGGSEGGAVVRCGDGACARGGSCIAGACACPPYMSACNGACIPTVADPKNCGGCGVACTGSLACSGGRCVESCLPGQSKCGNACADLRSDSANCGGCGVPCGPGTGCVDGACHPVVPVGATGPAACTNGGYSPTLDSSHGGCLGELAQTVFRWTLCSCKDAQFSGSWLIDAFDSTKGPYAPGGLGASFGTNENYGVSGTGELWGTMWIAGSGGVAPSLTHVVKGDLRSGGELKAGGAGAFTIGNDAHVLGDVHGSGPLTIGGTLFQAPGRTVSGTVNRGAVVTDRPVSVPPPCEFCGAARAVPIGAIVAAHRAPNNDNETIGLRADAFANPSSPLRLDLPCGHYFLSGVASSRHVTIVAHGRTALYVDGDVTPDGLTLAADPDGELNVFIAGSVGTSGVVRIGSPGYPAGMRVYVGGAAGFGVSDEVTVAGNLYVPNGPVAYSSNADQYGAMYANNFSTSKDLKLHYDLAVLGVAASTCPPPPASGGSSGSPPAKTCESCNECGNQACINGRCGDVCGASDKCCSPLVCVNGSCVPSVK